MGTVTIGSDVFNIYGSTAGATSYMNGRIGAPYAKYRGLVSDDQSRSLVTAAAYFDTLGLKDSSGNAISETTAIAAVINAAYEMAAQVALNNDIVNQLNQDVNIKVIGAGPARVEFFSPVKGLALPRVVYSLLSPFLPSATIDTAVGESSGVGDSDPFFVADDEDSMPNSDDFGKDFPL